MIRRDDDFRVRPGRIRDSHRGARRPKTFVGEVMRAAKKAKRVPLLGQYIATLEIPECGEIRHERTTSGTGHYTLWGPPEALRECVTGVTPVEKAERPDGIRVEGC